MDEGSRCKLLLALFSCSVALAAAPVEFNRDIRLVPAQLGNDAGIVGAALAAARR